MLDDLRSSAASSFAEEESGQMDLSSGSGTPESERLIFGMTAVQRFIIAFMLLMMTCVLGSLCLIAFEKVVLPIY